MNDLILSDEEMERLEEIDWREYDEDECGCTCGDEDCPYHAVDRVVERHEIWRMI